MLSTGFRHIVDRSGLVDWHAKYQKKHGHLAPNADEQIATLLDLQQALQQARQRTAASNATVALH